MRFLLVLLLLFAAFLVQAQEEETWTISERCLTEPSTPPEDWSYDGTILARSQIGIHGTNQDWETRRILAYLPNNTQFDFLSPDGKAWITFQGDSYCGGTCSGREVRVNDMTIHNLTSAIAESYEIEWELFTPDDYRQAEGMRRSPVLRWLNPTQFLYVKDIDDSPYTFENTPVVFDITTNEFEVYETSLDPREFHGISPDATLAIYTDSTPPNPIYQTHIVNLQNSSEIAVLDDSFNPLFLSFNMWSPDSQFFLASKLENPDAESWEWNFTIWLMNREGTALYSMIPFPLQDLGYGHMDVDWSPDGRYLTLFRASNSGNRFSWLIDLQGKHSYDLCFDKATSAAWSSESQHLALQAYNWETDSDALTVFEPATWSWYEVADNPDAWVVGWQG
jgi:hypothetical protein